VKPKDDSREQVLRKNWQDQKKKTFEEVFGQYDKKYRYERRTKKAREKKKKEKGEIRKAMPERKRRRDADQKEDAQIP